MLSPGDNHTKGLVVLLYPGLQGITEVDIDPKMEFVSFKVTPLPLMTEISVFMPLQGIAPRNSWLEGASLKDYKIIWKIKIREIKKKKKKKKYLETSNVLWKKMYQYGGNKTQILYICCSNYALIVDNG